MSEEEPPAAASGEVFHRLIAAEELAEGQGRSLVCQGWPIFVCKSDGKVYALVNRCTHAGSPFDGGRVRRGTISCPVHGAMFNLATGACRAAGHYRPLTMLRVQLTGDDIEVALPAGSPPDPGP
jgi:3-phenylpropionate/trans-cinnamate dioxygenase ferredoxin subunit